MNRDMIIKNFVVAENDTSYTYGKEQKMKIKYLYLYSILMRK